MPGRRWLTVAALCAVLVLAVACEEAAGTPPFFLYQLTVSQSGDIDSSADGMDRLTVTLGGAELSVEVAVTPSERQTGLSGREGLDADAGMLFNFPSGVAGGLWMKGMRFGLDFVWVGPGCTVVDVTQNVPPPQGPDDPLPVYRSAVPATAVIEIAAGRVEALGIAVGDTVTYGPSPRGSMYGCEP